MAFRQTTNSKSGEKTRTTQKMKPSSTDADSVERLKQVGLEELTPLQQRRLEAAVMILVNYLVSASSSG